MYKTLLTLVTTAARQEHNVTKCFAQSGENAQHGNAQSCSGRIAKSATRKLSAMSVLLLCGTTSALAQQSLEQGADQAVRGSLSQTVNVGRHGYRIQPVKIERMSNGIRASGRLDHKIKGHDDWVYYSIDVQNGGVPVVTIQSIEYHGIFGGSGKVNLAVSWIGRKAGDVPKIGEATRALNVGLKGLNYIQRKLVGNWEPTVPTVLDVLAARVAQEAK